LSPFYTAEGDTGETGYLGKGKISKASLRIEAVGCVDEANAAIGLARALNQDEKIQAILITVQKHLYYLMSEVSASIDAAEKFDNLDDDHVRWIEAHIEELENALEVPREFILPGGSASSGSLDLARTIVRRAERRVVALLDENLIEKPVLVAYLNRLSSLLFILELYSALKSGENIKLTKEA
jgi:cob(I)alamin adenosyltransferase